VAYQLLCIPINSYEGNILGNYWGTTLSSGSIVLESGDQSNYHHCCRREKPGAEVREQMAKT